MGGKPRVTREERLARREERLNLAFPSQTDERRSSGVPQKPRPMNHQPERTFTTVEPIINRRTDEPGLLSMTIADLHARAKLGRVWGIKDAERKVAEVARLWAIEVLSR